MVLTPDQIRASLAQDGKVIKTTSPVVTGKLDLKQQNEPNELDHLFEYRPSAADKDLDNLLNRLDVVTAYIKFCGKMIPRIGNRTESVMISCPKPDHADKTPSAWLNTAKQQWYCAVCETGGDKYDIAAYGLGYPVPAYKTTQRDLFPQLRRAMASKLGYSVVRGLGPRSEFLVHNGGDDLPPDGGTRAPVPESADRRTGPSTPPPPAGRTPSFPSSATERHANLVKPPVEPNRVQVSLQPKPGGVTGSVPPPAGPSNQVSFRTLLEQAERGGIDARVGVGTDTSPLDAPTSESMHSGGAPNGLSFELPQLQPGTTGLFLDQRVRSLPVSVPGSNSVHPVSVPAINGEDGSGNIHLELPDPGMVDRGQYLSQHDPREESLGSVLSSGLAQAGDGSQRASQEVGAPEAAQSGLDAHGHSRDSRDNNGTGSERVCIPARVPEEREDAVSQRDNLRRIGHEGAVGGVSLHRQEFQNQEILAGDITRARVTEVSTGQQLENAVPASGTAYTGTEVPIQHTGPLDLPGSEGLEDTGLGTGASAESTGGADKTTTFLTETDTANEPVTEVPDKGRVRETSGGRKSKVTGTGNGVKSVTDAVTGAVTELGTELSIEADSATPEADILLNPERYFDYPTLDWRNIVPPGTFLWEYLTCCSPDEVPEEYHFWTGLFAVGQALGRTTALYDSRPVLGNLFLCTIGPSGSGKSSAVSHIKKLLLEALPWEPGEPDTRGSKLIATPGSAEVMIKSFARLLAPDPSAPKVLENFPVKGVVDFPELSSLVGRTNRLGNNLQSTLIEFYDASPWISTSALSSGEHVARDSFCSVTTTTQLKSIKTLLTQKDAAGGFLNRWVYVMGGQKKRSPLGPSIIDISSSVPLLKEIVGWSSSVPLVRWTPEAYKKFEEFWYSYILPAKEADSNDMLTRIDLLVKKLILLFAANSHESAVSERTVTLVYDIFQYLLKTYSVVDDQVGVTEDYKIGKEIQDCIEHLSKKYKKYPTKRDIQLWLKGKKYTNEQFAKQLELLIRLELVEELAPVAGKIGRPTVRYKNAS